MNPCRGATAKSHGICNGKYAEEVSPNSCPSGRHKPQNFIETKTLRFCNPDTKNFKLDDGWPESVEEQGLLLLVWRHNFTNNI